MEARTLDGAGSVSHHDAVDKAEREHAKYKARIASNPSEAEEVFLQSIKGLQREIEDQS